MRLFYGILVALIIIILAFESVYAENNKFLVEVGGGVVDTNTGKFYPETGGGGYIDAETGAFIPAVSRGGILTNNKGVPIIIQGNGLGKPYAIKDSIRGPITGELYEKSVLIVFPHIEAESSKSRSEQSDVKPP